MPKGDLIPGLVSTAAGAVVLVYTLTEKNMTILASQATGHVPGPGFFPVICSSLLLLFGILLTIKGVLQKGKVSYFQITPEIKENIKIALSAFALLVLMLIAWKVTDQFIVCLFVYSITMNKLFKRSWLFSIVFSVLLVGLVYFMFIKGFNVTFKV